MDQIIKAIIDGHHQVDIVDAKPIDIVHVKNGVYHLIHDNQSHKVTMDVVDQATKTVKFHLDEIPYQVQLHDQVDVQVEKMGLNEQVGGGLEDAIAPMPGLVLNVHVNPGDRVEMGQSLLILEAMKMENVIKAGHPGVVKKIFVQPQDKIEKGQVMVTFEE